MKVTLISRDTANTNREMQSVISLFRDLHSVERIKSLIFSFRSMLVVLCQNGKEKKDF